MTFDIILYNIELIRRAVIIVDSNLNIIGKNAFAQTNDLKTRTGASINNYFNKPDITKLLLLENKNYVIMDFIKDNITSFVAVRYDLDERYYFLYEAHLMCFIEKRISLVDFVTRSKCGEHFVNVTSDIVRNDYTNIEKPVERTVIKYLKVYYYIRHLLVITYNPTTMSSQDINDIIYELNGLTKIFDTLSRSIGMNINYKPGIRREVIGKYNRGDVFLSALIMLYFAHLAIDDRTIYCSVMNYDTTHYFSVDFATHLPEKTVYLLISDQNSLNTLSDTCKYEYFFLLTQVKRLLNCYTGDIAILLPGNSLSNIRIMAKFVETSDFSTTFHESTWLDEYTDYVGEILLSSEQLDNITDVQPTTYERIYKIVKKIPKGKVANYGLVAVLAGNSRWSRAVGYALHVNPDPQNIPCHRVVTKNGELSEAFAFGGGNRQRELLEAEGVGFLLDGRVDLEKYFWEGFEV